MATDSTDPRVGLIFQIGVLSVGIFAGVHAGVSSYFDRMVRDETYRKVGSVPASALQAMREEQQQKLAAGAMPITKSMEMLATKGRMGASPAIMPNTSTDIAPLQGWTQMPGTVPPTMMPPPDPTPAPAASSSAAPAGSASAAPAGSGSAAPKGAPAPAPSGSSAPRKP